MKIKLKIRVKLLLSVILVTAAVYVVSLGYLVNKLRTISLRDAYEKADLHARENAGVVRTNLNYDMDVSRTMVHIFNDFRKIPQKQRADWFKKVIHGIAVQNPEFISVWGSWEINALDSTYKKPFGRHRYTYYWEEGELKYKEETLDTEGDNTAGGYYKVKISKQETMIDPYWFSYTENSKPILEASTAIPLIENGKFMGLFGLDIELTRYQTLASSIKPFDGSFSVMISNNGSFVAHPDEDLLGKAFTLKYNSEDKIYNVVEKVRNGENFNFTFTDSTSGKQYYASFAAIPLGKSNNPWSFGLLVPIDVLKQEANSTANNAISLAAIGLFVLIIVVWLIAYSITHPLAKTKGVLSEMAKGKIDKSRKIEVSTGDEVEEIADSINILIDGLSKTASFAEEIGRGNLQAHYERLSSDDVLGDSLIAMRKSLLTAQEQEKIRKAEDDKINWATQGMAKFAELLRQNNDNMEEFSANIVTNLVKYIDANIGALFLYNDDDANDPHFSLVASYAYNRRKFVNKRIEIGEGLVGRCAQERETIFLTELPTDYIQISSGLGEEIPTCLLLVPLRVNEIVYGVIEVAAFNVIDNHIVRFVEDIGESIAATISTIKINVKTVRLLEESRIKSEELASQEEEMRQNMEELQATQEEAARKSAEMESLINALNTSSYVIEYDTSGKVIYVNDAYLTLTNQRADAIIGNHHSDNMLMDEEQLREYSMFWDDLRSGKIRKETSKVSINNKVYTFIETYSPIYNENQRVVKILKIAHNITDFLGEQAEEKAVKGVRKKN